MPASTAMPSQRTSFGRQGSRPRPRKKATAMLVRSTRAGVPAPPSPDRRRAGKAKRCRRPMYHVAGGGLLSAMPPEPTGSPRLPAPAGLVRALGRMDTVLFVITAVVVLDTIGAVAVGGPGAVTWLAVMGIAFLVPSPLLPAELGAAFPAEGGHYVWTRLAFGRVAGAVSALLYWIETPIWIGGSLAITAIAVTEEFVSPSATPAGSRSRWRSCGSRSARP